MEIVDLRNGGIIVRGRIISAESWPSTTGRAMTIIINTGYRLTLLGEDIIAIDNAIDGIERD